MGEIADSLIDGEFDYITGEYLGKPCGYPRSIHEKSGFAKPVNPKSSDSASHGIIKFLGTNGIVARKEKRKVVAKFCEVNFIEYHKIGFDNSCVQIQQMFSLFFEFVRDYKKGAYT